MLAKVLHNNVNTLAATTGNLKPSHFRFPEWCAARQFLRLAKQLCVIIQQNIAYYSEVK